MSDLTRLPVKMLGDLVSPRALERIFQDAAQARGKRAAELDRETLEDILKKEVFKRLQLSVPAPLAKKRVSEVLNELLSADQTPEPPTVNTNAAAIAALEEGARRFSLYFDWAEAQRLRGLISVVREEVKAGRDISALLTEGQDLLVVMERRLQENLVAQAQDLAELQATFRRVEGMGNRDVRRLETLIEQIADAQKNGTLLPAEVERAHDLTFRLRKLLESSVVQAVGSGAAAPAAELQAEVQARVLALEQAHTGKLLSTLEREFAPVLQGQPELEARRQALQAEHQAGRLSSEAVEAWRAELIAARERLLSGQREEFAALERQLTELEITSDVRVVLDAARLGLQGGTLVSDELTELRRAAQVLAAGREGAGEQLALHRELNELERAARDVPGALNELAPLIAQAHERVAQGGAADVGELWLVLERYMGAAAQQREDFDARADHVIHEYDAVRDLAGETIQTLGRLADTLRAQRRLGPLSADARERYVQTLQDAEALLTEAHAEYRAAQEVTATFGAEALSDLLDVFDFGGENSDADSLSAAPEEEPEEGQPEPEVESWLIQAGQIVDGSDDRAAQRVVALLQSAAEAGIHAMELRDRQHTWAAHTDGQGGWRLVRAESRVTLDLTARHWLETGEG